jgi:hypothetical protein
MIRSAIFSYKGFAVHEGIIKPKAKQEQNTLILRDMPSHYTIEDILKVFSEIKEPQPAPVPNGVRSDMNNMWYGFEISFRDFE